MKRYALCLVLLLASPLFATTISFQKQANNWSCSGSSNTSGQLTCQIVNFTPFQQHDLLVIWTTWQSAGAFTASVADGTNEQMKNFPSAVGPTVQPAPSSPISAQTFYARNISSSQVTVTVTLTGPPSVSIPSFGAIVVEFSGADLTDPLDSASDGYSLVPGSVMNSGTVAPSTKYLLVFGGGTSDGTVGTGPSPGGLFTTFTGGVNNNSIVEYNNVAISANNVLWRADASEANAGNWLMEMAVFRDSSWASVGGWRPTRPPDVTNAAEYPGSDICVQAQNAAIANPYATILMVISGAQTCSVDPSGGWMSSNYNSGGPSAVAFQGKIQVRGIAGTSPSLAIDVPWVLGGAHNRTTDVGGVQIIASNNFRKNISGKRCFTAGNADNSGDEADCGTSVGNNAIRIDANSVGSCAKVTLTTGTSNQYDPNTFRGGQIINILNAGDVRNNGVFRIVPTGDNVPCGSGSHTPTNTFFYIYAPSAQSCTPGNCGTGITIVAESPMFYMHLRPWDTPYNSDACLDIDGSEHDKYCISQGVILTNLGEVDGIGYGIVGIDNFFCEEQCWVKEVGSRAVMRTSMMTFGWALSDFGSQNNNGFNNWEDYCGDPHDTSDCHSDGTHVFGQYHVGVWMRDGWMHGRIEDVTFNSSSWAGVMIDGMTGANTGVTIDDVHFQNKVSNQTSGTNLNDSIDYAGGNLCNIAIGSQATASSVYLEQIQSNSLAGVLANACIFGSTNHLPLTNLQPWDASGGGAGKYYPQGAIIKPESGHHNGSNYLMEVMTMAGGTSGSAEPCWDGLGGCTGYGSACSSYMPGGTCSDGGITWEIIGSTFPNDLGPGSSNQVKAINFMTSSAPSIFNAVTNQTWSDASISDYTYQNDSGPIYECASSLEHTCHGGQGFDAGSNSFVMEIANDTSTGTSLAKWVMLTGSPSTATVATASTSSVVGICVAGCGTSGNAEIAYGGLASCTFDGTTTAGHYFILSSSIAGDCTDNGTTATGAFGRVLTGGPAGTEPVFIGLHFQ